MTSAYVSAEGGNANGIASGMVSVARCVRCDAAQTQGNACSAALRLRARNALQRICVVRVLFARLGADRARQTLTDATLAAGGFPCRLWAWRFFTGVEEEEEDSISEDKTLLVYKHLPRFLLR